MKNNWVIPMVILLGLTSFHLPPSIPAAKCSAPKSLSFGIIAIRVSGTLMCAANDCIYREVLFIFKAILRVVGGKLESGNWHHQLIKGRVRLKGAKRLGCLLLALAAVLEVINCFLTVEAAMNPTPACHSGCQ